jgi:hypothetical protein
LYEKILTVMWISYAKYQVVNNTFVHVVTSNDIFVLVISPKINFV